MSIVNTLALESNRQIKINFDGGDLSSDAGLLLIKEFISKLGIDKLLDKTFKTNDSALFRYHTNQENLLQMIYMIIAGYFEDDASDELTNDPVFKSVLEKDTLAKASYLVNELDEITRNNKVDYVVVYGEFMYKAGPWPYERRVVCKVEKPENQMVYMYTFVVTNMDSSPEYLIKFYCKRGLMENFIKESKSGFDFASVSSHTRIVNANRLQVHALAYNIFNWFRRLALSANMRKQRIDTVRLKLLKIAAKVVHSARYITFKLCSSCPYKNEFYETLSNIGKLNVQLE